ncbi:DUF3572 domain-containing protein [Hoeflea sp.]|uniref:DUF3572 domain-containing protein n=1 Tax=Hoeflea sp. TaxID=1940281 RepID=UPI003747B91E
MADAEDTAIAVLVWLAGEPELMGRFLALTGLEANNLRDAAQEPGFLAGVLGFLMSHEPTLMDFCAATDTKPETVTRAFQALVGAGETP